MTKKIFLNSFLSSIGVAIIVFIGCVIAVYNVGRQSIKENLVQTTNIICNLLENDNYTELGKVVADETRITIINLNGDVVYDNKSQESLENHLQREEVQKAIANTPQICERYSSTFKRNMFYYAVKTSGDNSLIVRIAVYSSEVTDYILFSLPFTIIALLLSVTISYPLSKRTSKQVADKFEEVVVSLKSINAGDYKPIKTSMQEGELFAFLNETNEIVDNTKKYLVEINEQKIKLDFILNNISQGIFVLSSRNDVVFTNYQACKIFNITKNVIGKNLAFIIEDIKLYNSILEKINNKANGRIEFKLSGKSFSVSVCNIVKENYYGDLKTILIITDVTDEKVLLKQKSDFFSNASHELKTPLTSMQGLAELLTQNNSLDAQGKKQAERIYKESVRLYSLILDMLNLSNLEQMGKDEILEKVNLREISEELANESAEKLKEKNITFEIEGNGEIIASKAKITELIENLFSNAINYNKQDGNIKIKICKRNTQTIFEIADTGIGIAKEHLPRLCERFYRVDKSRSKKTGGTGLGLAIVKHICALYNAELNISSQENIGTIISISFNK